MVNAVAEGAPVLYATLESEPAFLALGPTHIAAGSWGPFFLLFIRFSFVLLSKRNVFDHNSCRGDAGAYEKAACMVAWMCIPGLILFIFVP